MAPVVLANIQTIYKALDGDKKDSPVFRPLAIATKHYGSLKDLEKKNPELYKVLDLFYKHLTKNNPESNFEKVTAVFNDWIDPINFNKNKEINLKVFESIEKLVKTASSDIPERIKKIKKIKNLLSELRSKHLLEKRGAFEVVAVTTGFSLNSESAKETLNTITRLYPKEGFGTAFDSKAKFQGGVEIETGVIPGVRFFGELSHEGGIVVPGTSVEQRRIELSSGLVTRKAPVFKNASGNFRFNFLGATRHVLSFVNRSTTEVLDAEITGLEKPPANFELGIFGETALLGFEYDPDGGGTIAVDVLFLSGRQYFDTGKFPNNHRIPFGIRVSYHFSKPEHFKPEGPVSQQEFNQITASLIAGGLQDAFGGGVTHASLQDAIAVPLSTELFETSLNGKAALLVARAFGDAGKAVGISRVFLNDPDRKYKNKMLWTLGAEFALAALGTLTQDKGLGNLQGQSFQNNLGFLALRHGYTAAHVFAPNIMKDSVVGDWFIPLAGLLLMAHSGDGSNGTQASLVSNLPPRELDDGTPDTSDFERLKHGKQHKGELLFYAGALLLAGRINQLLDNEREYKKIKKNRKATKPEKPSVRKAIFDPQSPKVGFEAYSGGGGGFVKFSF